MMQFILFRFWPALLPLLIYWLWHRLAVRRAVKTGQPVPKFRDGPIYWAVLSGLLIAIICFLWLGAHLEPGHVE